MLASRFESPERPALGITTNHIPRRTFLNTPNGERISVRHGGTVRQKHYTIPGLSFAEASQWIDLFRGGEGTELIGLDDGFVTPGFHDAQPRTQAPSGSRPARALTSPQISSRLRPNLRSSPPREIEPAERWRWAS